MHEIGIGLSPDVRDFVGDALWAAMMFAFVSAAWPANSLAVRAAVALAISWIVEFSQAYHAPSLDALRATTLGRLTLGTGFDPRDLLAYAVGVAVAAMLERTIRRRHG
ncbi:MAG TPA: DUF2809 domain-containing protein [Gemmatimonadaceae bacterium]